MKKLYFVRHAESEGNISAVQQGPDTPLSEQGFEQAMRIAERFRDIGIDRVISSPQTRAKYTAEAISSVIKIEKDIEYSELLIERKRPSVVIGMNRNSSEFAAIEDLIRDNFHTLEWKHSDEENFLDLKARAAKLLEYSESLEEENILMVSHGVFITMVTAYSIFGEALTSQEYWTLFAGTEHSNTGITVIKQSKFKNDPIRWKLLTWNDHAHLG
ncbi:MAG: histidine phosphatase family protein [Candidatus Paceibacterota bacterium]